MFLKRKLLMGELTCYKIAVWGFGIGIFRCEGWWRLLY